MKKLLVLALVLSMATVANAALTLGVSDTELLPSDNAVISISGDGTQGTGTFYLGITLGGPGDLNIENAIVLYTGNQSSVSWDDTGVADMLGLNAPAVNVQLTGTPAPGQENPPLTGLLINNIVLHCFGAGDVVVSLFDGDGILLDSKTITQTPEPITVGLLGLGALFLRRRSK